MAMAECGNCGTEHEAKSDHPFDQLCGPCWAEISERVLSELRDEQAITPAESV
jgi:hypothetical protein